MLHTVSGLRNERIDKDTKSVSISLIDVILGHTIRFTT